MMIVLAAVMNLFSEHVRLARSLLASLQRRSVRTLSEGPWGVACEGDLEDCCDLAASVLGTASSPLGADASDTPESDAGVLCT